MIVQTMVQICDQYLISRLKIGGALAVSLVVIETATLFLFLDAVFGLYLGYNKINKRRAIIRNDDVIVLMRSSN